MKKKKKMIKKKKMKEFQMYLRTIRTSIPTITPQMTVTTVRIVKLWQVRRKTTDSGVHTDEKQCPTCSKWIKKSSYNKHLKTHDGTRYHCPFKAFSECNADYSRTDALCKHIKEVHRQDVVWKDKEWSLPYPKLLPLIEAELIRMHPLRQTAVVAVRTTAKRQISSDKSQQFNSNDDFVKPLLALPLESRTILRNFFCVGKQTCGNTTPSPCPNTSTATGTIATNSRCEIVNQFTATKTRY